MAANPLIDVRGPKNRKSLHRLFSVSCYSHIQCSISGPPWMARWSPIASHLFHLRNRQRKPNRKVLDKEEENGKKQKTKKIFSFIFRKKTKLKQKKVSNVEGLLIGSGNKHKKNWTSHRRPILTDIDLKPVVLREEGSSELKWKRFASFYDSSWREIYCEDEDCSICSILFNCFRSQRIDLIFLLQT